MIGNIKVLSDSELAYLKEKYVFGKAIVEDKIYVVVKCKDYNRMVLHDSAKKFTINTPIKRITISKEAIYLWKTELFDYSLIEIQNAINSLVVTYQDLTINDIKEQIKNNNLKIKAK